MSSSTTSPQVSWNIEDTETRESKSQRDWWTPRTQEPLNENIMIHDIWIHKDWDSPWRASMCLYQVLSEIILTISIIFLWNFWVCGQVGFYFPFALLDTFSIYLLVLSNSKELVHLIIFYFILFLTLTSLVVSNGI